MTSPQLPTDPAQTTSTAPAMPDLRIQICLFSYGGITPDSYACLERDLIAAMLDPSTGYSIAMTQAHNDALIDRARATVTELFLKGPCNVLVMLDHDLSWQPGDLLRIARMAHENCAIVGAAVSKRQRGSGIASASIDVGIWEPGSDRLIEARYVGSAFTAYARPVLEAVMARMPRPVQGFRPGFIPSTWPQPHTKESIVAQLDLMRSQSVADIRTFLEDAPSNAIVSVHDGVLFCSNHPLVSDYLSEDWAACRRALELGFKCFLDIKPQVAHHGAYAYTIADAFHGQRPDLMQSPPRFALLHATRGRPEQALATRQKWLAMASGLHHIEYILSTDDDDPAPIKHAGFPAGTKLVTGPSRGNVDAYNRALYAAHPDTDIVIQVHDDLEPPPQWDLLVERAIGDYTLPAVLHVSDGQPDIGNAPDLLTVLIGTMNWFRKCGYFWHPSFVSIRCDDHMTRLARKEGVIIEAPDIVFKHDWQGADRDETQKRSYRGENWAAGDAAMAEQEARGFPLEPELWPK